VTTPAIDTTSHYRCPHCQSTDIYHALSSSRGIDDDFFLCRSCDARELRLSTAPDYRDFLQRWANEAWQQPTFEEMQQRIDETNRLFDETERQKTWPLESRTSPPTSRAKRQDELAFRYELSVKDGVPPKEYPENDALLAQVLESPDADAPRQAYAAWQRTQGYQRGSTDSAWIATFIEAQLEIAATLRGDPRADILPLAQALHPSFTPMKLRRGIMPNFGRFDLGVLEAEGLIDHAWFARGFIEHVAVKAHRFLEIADELYSLAPIRHLTITYVKGLNHDDRGILRALARSPHLDRIRSIRLPARMFNNHFTRLNQLTDEDLEILADSPHLASVAYLDLEDADALTIRAFDALATSRHLPRLSFVGADWYRYFRELGKFGKHARELVERRIERFAAELEQRHGRLPWLHPIDHYGTPHPDVEAVVEHPLIRDPR